MFKFYFLLISLSFVGVSSAQNNEELIIGNWQSDSMVYHVQMVFDEEMVTEMMLMSDMFTEEEFFEQFGFSMPQTEAEWLALIGMPFMQPVEVDDSESIVFVFDDEVLTLYDPEGVLSSVYEFQNDSVIGFDFQDDEFPANQFEIQFLDEDNLVMSFEMLDEDLTAIIYVYTTAIDELVYGCTDDEAENYNATANIDDGSCIYTFLCDEGDLLLTMYDDFGDGWEGSELVINGVSYSILGNLDEDVACVSFATCNTFSTVYGDNMDEAYWYLSDEDGYIVFEGGLPFDYESPDIDQDMVCDDADNCVSTYNPDQLDTDGDGEGDVCDYDDGLVVEEKLQLSSKLVKVVDLLGRQVEVSECKGKLLFYLYDDGSVVKRIY